MAHHDTTMDEIEKWRAEAFKYSGTDKLGHLLMNSLELMQSVIVNGPSAETLLLKTKALSMESTKARADDPNKSNSIRRLHYAVTSSFCALVNGLHGAVTEHLNESPKMESIPSTALARPMDQAMQCANYLYGKVQLLSDSGYLKPAPENEYTAEELASYRDVSRKQVGGGYSSPPVIPSLQHSSTQQEESYVQDDTDISMNETFEESRAPSIASTQYASEEDEAYESYDYTLDTLETYSELNGPDERSLEEVEDEETQESALADEFIVVAGTDETDEVDMGEADDDSVIPSEDHKDGDNRLRGSAECVIEPLTASDEVDVVGDANDLPMESALALPKVASEPVVVSPATLEVESPTEVAEDPLVAKLKHLFVPRNESIIPKVVPSIEITPAPSTPSSPPSLPSPPPPPTPEAKAETVADSLDEIFARCIVPRPMPIKVEIEEAPAQAAPVVQKSARQVWKMLALSRQQKEMEAKKAKTASKTTTARGKTRNATKPKGQKHLIDDDVIAIAHLKTPRAARRVRMIKTEPMDADDYQEDSVNGDRPAASDRSKRTSRRTSEVPDKTPRLPRATRTIKKKPMYVDDDMEDTDNGEEYQEVVGSNRSTRARRSTADVPVKTPRVPKKNDTMVDEEVLAIAQLKTPRPVRRVRVIKTEPMDADEALEIASNEEPQESERSKRARRRTWDLPHVVEEKKAPKRKSSPIKSGIPAKKAARRTIEGGRVECSVCQKKFSSESMLANHMNFSHPEEAKRSFRDEPSQSALKDLMPSLAEANKVQEEVKEEEVKKDEEGRNDEVQEEEKRKGEVEEAEPCFPCDECDQTFKIKDMLNVHLRREHGKKPFQCVECNERFELVIQLMRHKRDNH